MRRGESGGGERGRERGGGGGRTKHPVCVEVTF